MKTAENIELHIQYNPGNCGLGWTEANKQNFALFCCIRIVFPECLQTTDAIPAEEVELNTIRLLPGVLDIHAYPTYDPYVMVVRKSFAVDWVNLQEEITSLLIAYYDRCKPFAAPTLSRRR